MYSLMLWFPACILSHCTQNPCLMNKDVFRCFEVKIGNSDQMAVAGINPGHLALPLSYDQF